MNDAPPQRPGHWRRYRPLYLLLLVCIVPVIASYYAYYVAPPSGRTNYGELVLPQRPAPKLALQRLDGTPFQIDELRGRWLLLHADSSACPKVCEEKLWKMRQVRLTTGKDRDRVERVMLLLDDAPVDTRLLREFEGTVFVRADRAALQPWLEPSGATPLEAPIWIVDPLGNLMMRWPADADPNRMKRDLSRLLRASRVG